MDKDARRRLARGLRRLGFDTTKSYKDGTVRPSCTQCAVLVINGVACHEIGCPNTKRRVRR